LFRGFNEGEVSQVSEVIRRRVGCGRFVVIGPPRSGKTFFIENHLRNNPNTNVTVDEYTLGVPTAETEGGPGGREGVMGYLKRLMPWIWKFRDWVEVEDEQLKEALGNKGPKPVVEGAKRRIGDSPHMAYYIPWDSDEAKKCVDDPSSCALGADVGRALKLIKGVFEDEGIRNGRIRWFSVEYIPPGLVKEVVDLIKEDGEEGARKKLGDWINAYFKAIDTLRKFFGVGGDSLEWEESSVEFLENFVNYYAIYVIGGLLAAPVGAAALALVTVLTHVAFKREEKSYVNGITELRKNLEILRKPDGEFNELGRLLAYRVAYLMGMSYDEANEALMDITGMKTDELERIVEEIKGRIEELEEKVNELNNWINLLKQEVASSITVAGRADFEKGIVYPNVRVEDSELRIRVEDRYHDIVKITRFNELVSGIRGRLMSDDVVVVVGPKGIGKSTLAAATVWESLSNESPNNSEVGLVARVDVLNEDNYSRFQTFIENYSKEFVKYFGRLLILYDPVSTETYEEKPNTQPQQGQGESVEAYEEGARYSRIPKDIEKTIGYLIKIKHLKTLGDSGQTIFIVLPSDVYNAVYNALSEGARNALEKYKLDVSQGLINTEFLAKLIREYAKTEDKPNGCAISDEKISELAGNVAKFDSGHALIARLIGEELARNNCSVGEVETLISGARGRAKAFIILHINGLFEVYENHNATKEALVKVFALRRPFINEVRPGDPILTPGVVELMGVTELGGWLALRQHDLIEEAIEKLLDCIAGKGEACEDLGNALEPWVPGTAGILSEVSEKVSDEDKAVKYFVDSYGKEFRTTLRVFSDCWKRAALIIGYGLVGPDLVPKPEGLPGDTKYLGDALRRCGVDDYLLVGNKIPPLILHLISNYVRVSTEAFIDRYDKAIAEVNMVLNNARGRGYTYDAEELYGLGLASIIASAAGLGRPVEPEDADAALYIASFAIYGVVRPYLIMPILGALEPLRDKAPHRYLKLLALASDIGTLDRDTVRYILDGLNKVLDNYIDRVKGHAPSLVFAIRVYAGLLGKHRIYFNKKEVTGAVSRVTNLLNELGRFKSSLGIIAWANALVSALENEYVRKYMERKLGIDVVDKADEVLGELNKLSEKVQELMMDEEFMTYVESGHIKADEKAVRSTILNIASRLKHGLSRYRLHNGELDEAARLLIEAAEGRRRAGPYKNYLVNRDWVLRVEAIKGSLAGDKFVDEFRQLYEEAFNEKHFEFTARYLSTASTALGEYLVFLALTGGDERVERIKELLEEHLRVLNAVERVSVPTRLMLNALLGPKDRLDNELEGRLVVAPRELIEAFKDRINSRYLPALRVTLGLVKPEDVGGVCEPIEDLIEKRNCTEAVSAAKGDGAAVNWLREVLIDFFNKSLIKKSDWLKGLGVNVDKLFDEFMELVGELDAKSLVQLIAPRTSTARLALMLYALINGDEKLAKAHALYGAAVFSRKLYIRLFLDVYIACEKGCDLSNEDLRQAITKLFLSHI